MARTHEELTVREVTVRFERTVAVDDVSFELEPGGVLAVLGPSGCGKSTLLRAIAGLEVMEAGSVRFAGRDLAGVPTHRRGFALLFQDGQLFNHQSVAGNIAYPLRLQKVGRDASARRVDELLELVGLPGYGPRQPATLSGGEQQRVALARALAAEPRLLLLDEPLSALDRSLRERLASDLREILVGTGTTALLVTHDHDEAFTVADRMAVMLAGRLVQDGPTTQVWRAPASADVARFLGYTSVLDPAAGRRLLEAGGDGIEPGPAGLAVRRSALRLDPDGTLRARVVHAASARDAIRLDVEVDGLGRMAALAGQDSPVRAGDEIRLRLDTGGLAGLP